MTKTIEQLTARVRELEEEQRIAELIAELEHIREQKNLLWFEFSIATQQLAASQAYAEQLRDALKAATSICWSNFSEAQEVVLEKALAIPRDTSALDAYVAEKVKEETDRLLQISPELRKAMGESQIALWISYCDKKMEVEELTRQRDLAVEALEHIARSLPQIGVERVWMMDHANKVLSTIKESEAMAQGEKP